MVKFPRFRLRWQMVAGATLALAAAVFAAKFAAASYYASKSPLIAVQFDPGNGVAAGKSIALLEAVDPEAYSMSQKDRAILLDGLRRDPLSKVALRAFGVAEYIAGKEDGARTFMELAQRVSRRDAPTQMWMINDKAQAGNLPGAIEHYDKALSVSPSAANILFPSLTDALSYPEVVPVLAPYLNRGRSWADGFVLYATTNVKRASDLGRLIYAAAPLPETREREVILQQIVQRFVAQGDIRGARTFASRMMDAKPANLDQFAITESSSSERYAPLTWTLAKSGSIVGAFDGEGGVEVVAAPDTSGALLMRTMYLAPGSYRLEHSIAYPEEGEPLALEWEASCLVGEKASDFWSQTVPALAQDQRYSMNFRVPVNCDGVRLMLYVKDTERTVQAYIVAGDFELTAFGAGSTP